MEDHLTKEMDRIAGRNRRSRNDEIAAACEWWLSQQEIIAQKLGVKR